MSYQPARWFVLCCLLLVLAAAPAWAQRDVAKRELAQPDGLAPAVDKGALMWKALETHGNVVLEIGGKDVRLQKKFTNGEAPKFDALKDELKPGMYSYRIQFIPNKLQEDKDHVQGLVDQRRKLLALRELKMEQGDRDAAIELYKQANELRTTASEAMQKQQSDDEYEFFEESGQIVVEKDGQIKIFNLQKSLEEAREKELRDKALNPPQREKGQDGRPSEL